jgi:hypothetical protein
MWASSPHGRSYDMLWAIIVIAVVIIAIRALAVRR